MYKIVILGKSGDCSHPECIKDLNGLECQENFVDYIKNNNLKNKLDNGYLNLIVVKEQLYSRIIYISKTELSENELDELKNYTSSQLADGIGEVFEQTPCMYYEDEEVFVSPWYSKQVLTITQNEI